MALSEPEFPSTQPVNLLGLLLFNFLGIVEFNFLGFLLYIKLLRFLILKSWGGSHILVVI